MIKLDSKAIFLLVLAALCLASLYTWRSSPRRAERTVLVWTAGLSAGRQLQVDAFHRWLRANGHVDADGEPLFTVRLESTANQSRLIQMVSGTAGDLIDHVPVKRFAMMGGLEDITDFARENAIDPASGYGPVIGDLLTMDGRQYAYFCNLAALGLLVNVDTFEKYGMDPPPASWTVEAFERIGLEFVRRANPEGKRREVFFAGSMPLVILSLARSLGCDTFNETLTAAQLTRPEFVRALTTYHRWSSELRLIPTSADVASESGEANSVNGEATPQLAAGQYGMIMTGRYSNMDLRRFKNGGFRMSFSQFPAWDYPNLPVVSRNTAIFKGSKHKDYAKLFLKFLSSGDYNRAIIDDSDGLPPNPSWAADAPAFHHPKGRENEGNMHTNELEWAKSIGIPESVSVYYPLGENRLKYAFEMVENKLATPVEALKHGEDYINNAIRGAVDEMPSRQDDYRRDVERQKQVDEYKAAGRKLPAEWIANPFYLKYYRDKGMLRERPENG